MKILRYSERKKKGTTDGQKPSFKENIESKKIVDAAISELFISITNVLQLKSQYKVDYVN